MAKFTIEYLPDGSIKKSLDFFGAKYICRQSPFINGVSRTLDDAISDQLEKTGKYGSGIVELAYDAFDDMIDDPLNAIVKLTEVENRHADKTKPDLIDRAQDIVAALRCECTDCSTNLSCESGNTLCGYYCPNKDAANLIQALTEQIVSLRAQDENAEKDREVERLKAYEALYRELADKGLKTGQALLDKLSRVEAERDAAVDLLRRLPESCCGCKYAVDGEACPCSECDDADTENCTEACPWWGDPCELCDDKDSWTFCGAQGEG